MRRFVTSTRALTAATCAINGLVAALWTWVALRILAARQEARRG